MALSRRKCWSCKHFDIKCHLCGKINKIKTSSEHRSGKCGRLTYDIDTRAVLGSLHAGIGSTHLNNLFPYYEYSDNEQPDI